MRPMALYGRRRVYTYLSAGVRCHVCLRADAAARLKEASLGDV